MYAYIYICRTQFSSPDKRFFFSIAPLSSLYQSIVDLPPSLSLSLHGTLARPLPPASLSMATPTISPPPHSSYTPPYLLNMAALRVHLPPMAPSPTAASPPPSHGFPPGASPLSLALPLANFHPRSFTSMPPPLGGLPLAYAPPSSSDPPGCLSRIKLADILPEDGAPSTVYSRAVEGLSNCLARQGVAIVELNGEDAALVRCALESSKLYFRSRAQTGPVVQQSRGGAGWCKSVGYVATPSRDMYCYRAGRKLLEEEVDVPPPCMSDVFRCLGKASRTALGAIARQLRLRSDAFNSLLDDCPLPMDEISSSMLVATHFHTSGPRAKGSLGGDSYPFQELEKGLLTLIASDTPGLQVCDPNGQWYLADSGLQPGDLLLLTGRAMNHATAGFRCASSYRVVPLLSSSSGRTSLTFRLMPHCNATLDGSSMSDAGHTIAEGFGPVNVSKFMERLTAAEALIGNGVENNVEVRDLPNSERSLRNVLTDPLTGALLEDAYTSPGCGHSFGGATLKRVTDTHTCSTCGSAVDIDRMIPNIALRQAAKAFKHEECRRQMQLAARKRRKESGEQGEKIKRLKESVGSLSNDGSRHIKGVQYPFSVNERVLIKGNKRTPEKFMGREAIVTSQCLNGWYLLRTLDTGASVRLQYRSLQKLMPDHTGVNDGSIQPEHPAQLSN